MTDLEIIYKLQKDIGIEIKETSDDSLLRVQTGYTIKENKVIGLKLRQCRLEKLPHYLSHLSSIKTLNLSENHFSVFPASIIKLHQLESLNLNGNQIRKIPKTFINMKNIRFLYLNNNQFEDIPISIFKLSKLSVLCMRFNRISTIPESIQLNSNLQSLDIAFNHLTTLPTEIGYLSNLKKINFQNNSIKSTPPSYKLLSNLRYLNFGFNDFKVFPSIIPHLSSLRQLIISHNQLTTIPEEINKLRKLQKLTLSNNPIHSLPDSFSGLDELETLILDHMKLEILPDSVYKLKNLKELNIRSNRMSTISDELGSSKNMQFIMLSENDLTILPKSIASIGLDISWSHYDKFKVNVKGNPFTSPPVEIVKQGNQAIIDWWNAQGEEKRSLNEAKVIIVGDGKAGKTSLVKRLFKNDFNPHEPETHGINITNEIFKIDGEKISANFWDFGGQDIMLATHQFFLSKRSLYIIVLDSRKDSKVEYWLKNIRSFGENSPVLIVTNKIDENPGFRLDEMLLKEKYRSIRGFYRISCSNKQGISDFRNALQKELANVEMINSQWPLSWFNVKTSLEKMSSHFINRNKYLAICKKNQLTDESTQTTLVGFLNDLGVILHFDDFNLDDIHVLNPHWATGGVYRIINSPLLAENKGILNLQDLKKVLRRKTGEEYSYPREQHGYLVDLMKKFELCYELNKPEGHILVPDLLDKSQPPFDFDFSQSLKLHIDYDFLPRSIIPRFIVNMSDDILNDYRWRTGVILQNDQYEALAMVRADIEEKRIQIFINGEQRRDYLMVILYQFRRIHESFEKLDAIEKVCLPDEPHIGVGLEHLIILEKNGVKTHWPEGAKHLYNVQELLGNVCKVPKTEEEIIKLLREIKRNTDTKETLFARVANNPWVVAFGTESVKMIIKKTFFPGLP